MILYHAAWVLPIVHRPLSPGWVLVSAGRVVRIGGGHGSIAFAGTDPRAYAGKPASLDYAGGADRVQTVDLGAAVVLPGLVNAHTHLELSWMRDRIPPSTSMPVWAARLLALRGTVPIDPPGPIAQAIGELRAAGTAVVGDVTNTLAAYDLLANSTLAGAVFRELIGFSHSQPEQLLADAQAEIGRVRSVGRLRPSIVPHAPYSVSAELFRAIARAAGERPISLHLAESADEIRFLQDGTGAWRDLLGQLGVWRDSWQPPSCGPIEYLERLGLLNGRLLAVHGTQLTDGELKHLALAGSTLVTCPRSNQRTGAGIPPVARFYGSGVRVAIGTDSLASVPDLNLFAELSEMRRLAPGVPAATLLRSATIDGATALGFGGDYGTIEAGKHASLVAVRIPADVEDVEEYLVGGIEPHDVTWLDTH